MALRRQLRIVSCRVGQAKAVKDHLLRTVLVLRRFKNRKGQAHPHRLQEHQQKHPRLPRATMQLRKNRVEEVV